jgi:hypothetical protein
MRAPIARSREVDRGSSRVARARSLVNARAKGSIAASVAMAVVLISLVAMRKPPPDSRNPQDARAPASSGEPAPSNRAEGGDGGTPNASDPIARALARLGDAGSGVLLRAKWGSGKNELGRDRPQEGNPEAPMSLAVTADGMIVVDQINGRLMKYDAQGRLERSIDATPTTQDVAVGKDGTIATLDRLSEHKVVVYDRGGRKSAELHLSGERVGETGLVTGVFVDGKDVYVEKEHGVLVHVGTTDGQPSDEQKELVGRPTKDGALLVSAVLSAPRSGVAMVNGIDRKSGALRFARAVQFPAPAREIVMLDSDARGIVYLGVSAGPEGIAEIACMHPSDGHVIGRVDVQLSTTPEETFRDFAVRDDGTIVYALRGEDGVSYATARCP